MGSAQSAQEFQNSQTFQNLQQEGIILQDFNTTGSIRTKRYRGPGGISFYSHESTRAFVILTNSRLIIFPQTQNHRYPPLDIPWNNSAASTVEFQSKKAGTLRVSAETSHFSINQKGVLSYVLHSDIADELVRKCLEFVETLDQEKLAQHDPTIQPGSTEPDLSASQTTMSTSLSEMRTQIPHLDLSLVQHEVIERSEFSVPSEIVYDNMRIPGHPLMNGNENATCAVFLTQKKFVILRHSNSQPVINVPWSHIGFTCMDITLDQLSGSVNISANQRTISIFRKGQFNISLKFQDSSEFYKAIVSHRIKK